MNGDQASASGKKCKGERIEWTGAGAGHFLAVVVDNRDEVIAERWGTRKEVLAWMEEQWPHLPVKYAIAAAVTPAPKRKRRRQSTEQRKAQAERMRAYWATKGKKQAR